MVNNFNNLSGYQEMLRRTAPISQTAEDYAERIAKALAGQKRITVSQKDMAKIPSKDLGYILKQGSRNIGKSLTKSVGKSIPALGFGASTFDAGRSLDLALKMEEANRKNPNTYPQEAIDYYKTKAKVIGAGMGLGGLGGGITGGLITAGTVGGGAGSIPLLASLGAGVGGGLASDTYQLLNIINPYAEMKLKPEIIEEVVKSNDKSTNEAPKELPKGMDKFEVLTGEKYNPPKIESVDIEKAKSAQVKPTVTSMIPSGNQQVGKVQPGISELLANYGVALQQGNAPYLEALQAYVDNYNRNIEDSDRRRRYYTALAGLSGNQGYLNLANVNDPRQVELDRINTINALQNARMGNIDKLYQAIGNEAIAQQIGLPEGSGFANKDLLSAFTGQQKSLLGLQGKMYGADMGYNARVFDSVMDSETQKAIAQGRIDVALQLQAMKNDASYRNALVNASGFGATPQSVQAMLQQFGYQPAIGLNREGMARTQSGVEDFSDELKGNK